MADADNKIKAGNTFGLPSSFGLQRSNKNTSRRMENAFGNTAAPVASDGFETRLNYTQDVLYCGTTLKTDLGALATSFGQVSTAGTELVTNGDFSDGTTGWSLSNASVGDTLTVSGGVAEIYVDPSTAGPESPVLVQSGLSCESGKTYVIEFDAKALEEDEARIRFDGDAFGVFQHTLKIDWQTFRVEITATATGTFRIVYDPDFNDAGGPDGVTAYLRNISAREARGADYSAVLSDLSVSYSAGQNPSLTLSGHNHETLAHATMSNTVDISGIIPEQGFGVPDFGITTGPDCSPISANLTANIEHFDIDDADGTHIHGENTKKVTCSLNIEFSGIPTSNDEATLQSELKTELGVSHLEITSIDENSGNGEFDSFALTAEFYV